jgi:hypothetical protein
MEITTSTLLIMEWQLKHNAVEIYIEQQQAQQQHAGYFLDSCGSANAIVKNSEMQLL